MTRLLPSRYILLPGLVLTVLGLLIVLLAMGSPDRASAQSAALVSNVGKGNTWTVSPRSDYAQEFTTGSNTLGYTLTSVDIQLAFPSPPGTKSVFSVAVHASSSGEPGNRLATLTAPQTIATGNNTFTHTGLDLSASTSYVVVVDGGTTGTGSIRGTDSNDEDSTAGWIITNGHKKKTSTGTTWTDDTGALQIRVSGAIKYAAVPGLTASPVSGSSDKLDVSWNAPTGVTFSRYNIRWKTSDQTYDSPTGSTTFAAPATSYQITGLTANTEYGVQIRAINPPSTIAAQSETTATTNPPAVPGFTVTPVSGSTDKTSSTWIGTR